MNGAVLAIAMLCFFGCKHEPPLDENPEHWGRISVLAGDEAVTFSVPHGYTFEGGGDPRPPERIDLTAGQTRIFKAEYEIGSGQDSDLPEFQIFVMLSKYVHPREDANFEDLQAFAQAKDEARRADARGEPVETLQNTEVTLAGRPWLHLTGSAGPNSYATPFSRTHLLIVAAGFWGRTQHTPEWFAARRRILESVVKSIVITEQK